MTVFSIEKRYICACVFVFVMVILLRSQQMQWEVLSLKITFNRWKESMTNISLSSADIQTNVYCEYEIELKNKCFIRFR